MFICLTKGCIEGVRFQNGEELYHIFRELENILKIPSYNGGILTMHFDKNANTRCLTGTAAIFFLLHMEIQELGIYGIDWLQYGYNEDYNGNRNKKPHGYDIIKELRYIRNFICNNISNIKITYQKETLNVLNKINE